MRRLTYDYVKEYIESTGYSLISTEYKNGNSLLDIRCPLGHEFGMRFANFKNSGQRCPICNNSKHNIHDIKFMFLNKSIMVLDDEYTNTFTPLNVLCKKCNREFKLSQHNFKNNRGCPHCDALLKGGINSSFEKQVREFVSSIVSNDLLIFNDVATLVNPYTKRRLELDIFLPSMNKAIEVNGTWHKQEAVMRRDKIKSDLCIDKGIDLFYVEHRDWNNKSLHTNTKNRLMEWLLL